MPCQSLEMALLNYRTILEDDIMKMYNHQLAFIEMSHFQLVHLQNIKEQFETDDFFSEIQTVLQKREQLMKVRNGLKQQEEKPEFHSGFKSASSFKKQIAQNEQQPPSIESPIKSSNEILFNNDGSPLKCTINGGDENMTNLNFALDLIGRNQNEAIMLCQAKQSKDLYSKFKEFPKLKELNRLIQTFLSDLVQQSRLKSQNSNQRFQQKQIIGKSILKQKDYQILISDNLEIQTRKEFKPTILASKTRNGQINGRITMEKINSQYIKNLNDDSQSNLNKSTDVEMKDQTDENVEDKQNSGFKRASIIGRVSQNPNQSLQNFDFMKKQVSINSVDIKVQEYELEKEEVDQKLGKAKRK
ncbi:UNKNOWN [Stylonychia lemnae]|uniref:Uncharacterized protein n=1 Tax=Stylonychia lemnae TaxID=5949 RepID=A0A078B8T1_STYLE|nr:UNKNOWN [Stylonychia lemnae]|eukprot:CDW89948.1 UNKNOWN [Stylonychia lemnae]